jgi:hypothetical protein
MKPPVVEGGRRAMLIALACAVLGLGATALRFVYAPKLALFSYLTAFAYFLGLSLASLLMLMIFHAARARWMVVVRRIIEVQAAAVMVFPLLFVPIALGFRILYPWAGSHEGLDAETAHVMHHRAVYLNVPFFFTRAVIYFALWILFSWLFLRWSTRQDASGEPRLTAKAWRLGAGGLPAIGITLTFAALDWLMTLSTRRQLRQRAGAGDHRRGVPLAHARARGRGAGGALLQSREAPAGVHLLLGLHRVLAVHADLDGQPARHGAVPEAAPAARLVEHRRAADRRPLGGAVLRLAHP